MLATHSFVIDQYDLFHVIGTKHDVRSTDSLAGLIDSVKTDLYLHSGLEVFRTSLWVDFVIFFQ